MNSVYREAAPDATFLRSARLVGAARRVLYATVRYVFLALLMSAVLYLALAVAGFAADPAFAQQRDPGGGGGGGGAGGDGGAAIQGAIDKATQWLSGIMTSLGGLGLVASIGVKAVARTNESMHHAAHMGMTGSCIAILAGLLTPSIISLVTSFAQA